MFVMTVLRVFVNRNPALMPPDWQEVEGLTGVEMG